MRAVVGASIAMLVAACGDQDSPPPDGTPAYVWGNLAAADGTVYWGTYGETDDDDHAIWAMTGDAAPRLLWQGGPHALFGSDLAVDDSYVYWTSGAAGDMPALYRVPRSGGRGEKLGELTTMQATRSVAATSDAVYASNENEILIATKGGARTFYQGDNRGFVIHGDVMYALVPNDETTSTILAIDLARGEPTTLATLPIVDWSMAVDDTALYVAVAVGIARVPLDGTAPDVLANIDAHGMVVDHGAVYAVTEPGDLLRVPLDRSTPTTLRTGLHDAFGLALDGKRLWIAQCDCHAAGSIEAVDLP